VEQPLRIWATASTEPVVSEILMNDGKLSSATIAVDGTLTVGTIHLPGMSGLAAGEMAIRLHVFEQLTVHHLFVQARGIEHLA